MDDTAKPNRALPIGVAAALAIVVFGVLFAVNGGPGKSSPSPAPSLKPDDKPAVADNSATPPGDKPADTKPADTKPADTKPADTKPADTKPTETAANPPAAAAPDAGAAAVAAPEAKKTVVLTVNVKPADAKVTVDGKPVSGGKIELPVSDHPVKVAASAPGYQPYEGDAGAAKDGSVTIDLKKEVAAAPKEPKNPPAQPKNPPSSHPKPPKKPKVEL